MKRTFCFAFFLVHLTAISFSQQPGVKISGKVSEENGNSVPGVNILEKGTMNGTITDINGSYTLTVASENSVITFSFVGFATKEELVGNRTVINIQLIEDVQALDEVVVIGYGTVKKSDLTGSVSSISIEDSELSQTGSVEQLLQGKAAGVMITKTSAKPGGAISVKIRGNNSINAGNEPLYVIDGFPISSNEWELSSNMTSGGPLNPLATINPNDIESVEILNEALENENLAPEYPNPDSLGEGTDWQDELFRVAPTMDINLSFSGGQENLKYFLSANYFSQDGIIHNTDMA